MRKRFSLTLALMLALALCLVACSDEGGEAESPAGATTSDPAFTESTIPVLRDTLDSTETAAVRIYEDMPNVPYMSVTDYYNQFYLVSTDLSEGMTFAREGDAYTVTNFCGDVATFDAATETVVIDNMTRFVKLACDLESLDIDGADPDYPYAKIGHTLEPETATPKTLALADYDIDVRGDDSGVYLPVPTLSDLFASASGYFTVYAGGKLYVKDYVGLYLDGSALDEDPDYLTAIKADRPEDLVKFTYDELCLNMDLWYGKPGQEYVHEDLQTKGLDEVISGQFPEIKEMLLASDFETFYAGLNHVFNGILFDGGHTTMACMALIDDEYELSTQLVRDVRAKDYGQTYNIAAERMAHKGQRLEAREALYHGENYVEQGDTAIICFDQFVVDSNAWKAFYAGEGERPLGDDTVGILLSCLERAAQNPEIRNIIIDDSCNDGGNDIAMLAIEWMMTGKGYIHDKDALTEQINTKSEVFDINLDGKLDDSDVSPYTGFRYAVLTSDGSFSCGNAFPWFMHEHGAMIMGERSGGGACGIRLTSVGGIEISCSAASSCTVTDEGESVDNGCPVDVDLTVEGENPYVGFYDLGILSERMNEYYDSVEAAA